MLDPLPSRFAISLGSASTASTAHTFSYTPSPPSTSHSHSQSRPHSSHTSPPTTAPPADDLRTSTPHHPSPFLSPLLTDETADDERRAVQRRRREEQLKRKKMLDRRTVVDVRKIREDKERRLQEAADGGSAAKRGGEEEERKERERKAEELMRQAMRREDEKRTVLKLNRLKQQQQQQQHSLAPLSSPHVNVTSRLEVDESEDEVEQQDEDEQLDEDEMERRVEESKEQLTRAEHTFITATNDLHSAFANTAQPQPNASSSPSLTSRTSSTRTPSTPTASSSSAVKASHASTSDDGSGLSAYTTFLQQRVRHMLVSNGIFIPVGDDGLLLVNTGYNASLAAQHALVATRPPSPAPPQFHLPSLQPPTSHFLPSSASIHLASSDERQLYELMVFLARVPLLQGCAMDVFFRLSSEVKEARFDEYEVIANEGEEADWIFLIREGRIDTKLNLERNGLIAATHNSTATKPPTPTSPSAVHTAQSAAGGGSGGGGSNSSLRRRFYSVNTASLDVSCLSTFDLCGESVLSPARRHLTSLISMTASACYSLSASSLVACLPVHTLTSLSLYSAYTSSLISLYTALRSRYRSSYHTSVVDFRLFVEGSLRRNLRHANERSRMRKEIERLGGDGGWMRDRQASRQIRHMQLGQRRVSGGGWRKGRASRLEEEEKEQLVGEVAVGTASMGSMGGGGMGGVRRSVTLPPVFLSFTTLNFGDTPVYSTDSSPMSSVQSRQQVLPPVVEPNANIHPALR